MVRAVTSPYTADLLKVIDRRATVGRAHVTAVGTVASRTYDMWAMVTLDGSSLAVPVRMSADVDAHESDRVGLIKFGADWVVTACFTRRWPAVAHLNAAGQTGSTTSASYTAMPGAPQVQITKMWDTTRLQARVDLSLSTTVATTNVEIGVSVDGATAVPILPGLQISQASVHTPMSATGMLTGVDPGTRSVALMWRRPSGTGTLQTDGGDYLCLTVTEVGPA